MKKFGKVYLIIGAIIIISDEIIFAISHFGKKDSLINRALAATCGANLSKDYLTTRQVIIIMLVSLLKLITWPINLGITVYGFIRHYKEEEE